MKLHSTAFVLLFTLVVLGSTLARPVPAVAVADVLPDLGMAPLRDIRVQKTADGRRLLRFTTVIVNVGAGPFELRGQRSSTDQALLATRQRIFDDAQGYREFSTRAVMYYAGDGHNHWHVRNFERYSLRSLDSDSGAGTGAKHGFCFGDIEPYRLTLPNAPQSKVYRGCGGPAALQVRVGLSVGWGDVYSASIPDQYIEITGLPPGRYRLSAVADPANWLVEANDTNNRTWIDIALDANGVRVLRVGPSA